MIQIPDNFPSYTSYNAKRLLQDVDTLKAACRELQTELLKCSTKTVLEAVTSPAVEPVKSVKPAKIAQTAKTEDA